MHINNLEEAVKVKTQLNGARRILKDLESGIVVSTRAMPGSFIPVKAETLAAITKLLTFDAGIAEQELSDRLTDLGVDDVDEGLDEVFGGAEEPPVSIHVVNLAEGVHPASVIADLIANATASAKANARSTLG